MQPEAPEWFTWAIAQRPDHHDIDVDGTRIRYRAWGDAQNPPMVLVHGGAAHSGWWDHVGPHLADHHRVLAIDLAGHGDSGRQDVYTLEAWAEQVLAVAATESDQKPVVFGHSMGGFVALSAARDHGAAMHGAAAIDSPIRDMPMESREAREKKMLERSHRATPEFADLVARFRTMPEDAVVLDYVKHHVAENSVTEVEGGWAWKFDPRIFLRSSMNLDQVTEAACEVALIRGELGLATKDITEDVRVRLGGRVPVTMIPQAGHHIMMDQPVALIAVLQTLAGQWRNR